MSFVIKIKKNNLNLMSVGFLSANVKYLMHVFKSVFSSWTQVEKYIYYHQKCSALCKFAWDRCQRGGSDFCKVAKGLISTNVF